jgi:hypothetical protein
MENPNHFANVRRLESKPATNTPYHEMHLGGAVGEAASPELMRMWESLGIFDKKKRQPRDPQVEARRLHF